MKRNEIALLLPEVFRRTVRPGSPQAALLAAVEALQEPAEDILRSLETFFSPYRAPDDFIPFLAGWVDLDPLLVESPKKVLPAQPSFPSGLGRLRELIAAAAYLSRWRGTAQGLLCFLETATGAQGFAIDEVVPGPDGKPRPFHIRVRAPAEMAAHRELLERIVEFEKPAYVTYELQFGQGG